MFSMASATLAKENPVLQDIIEKIDEILFRNEEPTFFPANLASKLTKSEAQVTSALRLFEQAKWFEASSVVRCSDENCDAVNDLDADECSRCGQPVGGDEEEVYRLSNQGRDQRRLTLGGFETAKWPDEVEAYRGKVDAFIMTMKDEEFDAVLNRIEIDSTVSGRREWNMARVWSRAANRYWRVALIKTTEQANLESQDAARDAIEDLQPGVILIVGIAGAVPGDLTLGDVILADHVHDMTLEEVSADGTRRFDVRGNPATPSTKVKLANVRVSLAKELAVATWPELPPLPGRDAKIRADDETKEKIQKTLARRYCTPRRAPLYTVGAIASSDRLLKFSELIADWKQLIRSVRAVEMESAGACKAARRLERTYSVIPIRAISDVIGLARDEQWTEYACDVAAEFALAFVRSWKTVPS